ncbi:MULTISPECIES: type II toxin-antitoxin system Phd/YefM family antitoxin [unclassified Methylobacterium]|uniref:type II toxin-antitoxin system Phd/YefM family antitoxin n=1 Tax=unclassified Methylobacterium TaxID=2615210 RepID=UPI0013544A46|nr:type II toxin-antitoxin system prevent-host-death family antitoxin [Methylobacterium sp. 2A]MWV25676.1 type II toxin-antitoxin system Phd/YefM family antitoxin [Methylobacterium sp. 2A]
MTVTTLSSRAFQQNASHAQKAAENGPVFITRRGEPVQVLLSIAEYRRLSGQRRNIVEALSYPGLSDIDLDIPRAIDIPRPADLS